MDESDGENDQTPRPRKQRKLTRKGHSKAHAPALEPRDSLPSHSASQAGLFKRYGLREKLEAVLRSVLRS